MNINIDKLTVLYKDKVVGYLKQLDDSTISFQYDIKWIDKGFSISPLSLPLTNQVFISKSKQLVGLYGVFWDVLPQGWGRKVLQKALLKYSIDYSKLNILTKLSFTTNNPRGALRFKPTQLEVKTTKEINLGKINNIAKKIINDSATKDEQEKIIPYSSTTGGAKPKIHIDIGNESWIIKLNTNELKAGLNEYKSNRLAKDCNINVNQFRLFNYSSTNRFFGVKRFDRGQDNKPIHMISLCGLLETTPAIPNLDYYILFQVIDRISINKIDDMYEAFKRMVFNILYGNKDDHGCNWSFLYDENLKGYKLSPFYDITFTGTIYKEHEMSLLGKGNPTVNDFYELAKRFNLCINECKKIVNKVVEVLKTKQTH